MKKERLQQILALVQQDAAISTAQAETVFHASAATIRRDFQKLEDSGLAVRIHGGLRRIEKNTQKIAPLNLREVWDEKEKRILVKKAVDLIGSNRSVMLYGGSTTIFFGSCMNSGTIITDQPGICAEIMQRYPTGNGPEVILTGGTFDCRSGNLHGEGFRRTIEKYRCDFSVVSAYAADEEGLSELNEEYATELHQMLERGRTRIALLDHTKFSRPGVCRAAVWNEIDLVITVFDPGSHPVLQRAREAGVKVIFAEQ